MALMRQTWTLTKKNLLIVLVRHGFFTTIRAFLAPIIFVSPVPTAPSPLVDLRLTNSSSVDVHCTSTTLPDPLPSSAPWTSSYIVSWALQHKTNMQDSSRM